MSELHEKRVERLLGADTEAEYRQAWEDLEQEPREPGRYKIRFGDGAPPRDVAVDTSCPLCQKRLRSRHALFGSDLGKRKSGEPITPEYLTIAIHWSEDCPHWRSRVSRLWYNPHYAPGRWTDIYKSWKWRRRARRERKEAGLPQP